MIRRNTQSSRYSTQQYGYETPAPRGGYGQHKLTREEFIPLFNECKRRNFAATTRECVEQIARMQQWRDSPSDTDYYEQYRDYTSAPRGGYGHEQQRRDYGRPNMGRGEEYRDYAPISRGGYDRQREYGYSNENIDQRYPYRGYEN